MRCTFLANCGLLLESDDHSILVDAPNGLHTAFDGVSDAEFEKMLHGMPPYDGLCAMFFTHRHLDHYDKKRVRQLSQTRPDVAAYAPNGLTPLEGQVQAGDFTVRYFTIGHSGEEFSDVSHRVLLVEVEGKRLYITGDAMWNELHLPILQQYSPNAAVWNPNFLTHEEGRALLGSVPRNFIYHLPVFGADVFGFGRKCETSFEKYQEFLPPTTLIKSYPISLEL